MQNHNRRLYTAGQDGMLRIWDSSNLRDDDDIYSSAKENGVKK